MSKEECKYCHGKGYYLVQTGPNDVDKELCEYCSEPKGDKNGTDNLQNNG